MVREEVEVRPFQVETKHLDSPDDSEVLLFANAIVSLRSA